MLSIRLARPADLGLFCGFLRDVHVRADVIDDGVVRASIAGAPTAHHARRELLGYLTTWNALHPARQVELLDSQPEGSPVSPV